MVVLGLLILIAVAAVVVVMLMRGDDEVRIDLDSLGAYRTDASVVFIVGAVTVLVGVLGFTILLAGLKRARRRRAEVRELKDRARRVDEGTGSHGATHSASDRDGGPDEHFDSTPRER